jgi:hypothetical protein
MPESPKKTLHKFLLNLVEKPQSLRQLSKDPSGFINKSPLAQTHKKILLSSDPKKIKTLVSGAVTGEDAGFIIQAAAGAQPGGEVAEGFHIVFGAKSNVKVSLKPKGKKPGQVQVAAAITIVTGAEA